MLGLKLGLQVECKQITDDLCMRPPKYSANHCRDFFFVGEKVSEYGRILQLNLLLLEQTSNKDWAPAVLFENQLYILMTLITSVGTDTLNLELYSTVIKPLNLSKAIGILWTYSESVKHFWTGKFSCTIKWTVSDQIGKGPLSHYTLNSAIWSRTAHSVTFL